jgi:hypothetical protein
MACTKTEPLRQIAITDTSATVAEYKKFLRMMVDSHRAWFTPSKLVDELWHRHILDTVAYCNFCRRVNGAYLHHTPHYGKPHTFHDPGFKATLQAYEDKYERAPPDQIWGTVGESGGGNCGGGYGGGNGIDGNLIFLGGAAAFVISIISFVFGVAHLIDLIVTTIVRLSSPIQVGHFDGYLNCNNDFPHEYEECEKYWFTPSRRPRRVVGDTGGWTYLDIDAQWLDFDNCIDLRVNSTLREGGTSTWQDSNGRSCALYEENTLCKVCDASTLTDLNWVVDDNEQPYGGVGWKSEWGTPGDAQHATSGLTAVDACCACGGGDTPLTTAEDCRHYKDACYVLQSCSDTNLKMAWFGTFVVFTILLAVCCRVRSWWNGSTELRDMQPYLGQTLVASYSYQSDEPQDLHFDAGAKIEITSVDPGSGWVTGKLEDGTTGIFPSNYVRQVGSVDMPAPPQAQATMVQATVDSSSSSSVEMPIGDANNANLAATARPPHLGDGQAMIAVRPLVESSTHAEAEEGTANPLHDEKQSQGTRAWEV